MSKIFSPPLAVFFVWNPLDAGMVNPILDAVRKNFGRDKVKPFSRGLNIPLFFFSSQNCNDIPNNVPKPIAERNVVFIFTSVNTIGRPNWSNYIENFPISNDIKIVPVATDKIGLTHSGTLLGVNCIRSYDWGSENKEYHAIVSLAHEIYRFGFSSINYEEAGKESSVNIFLSHAKADETGLSHAEEIKRIIDNTNMNHFFDTTEISPGYLFGSEIEKYIVNSTLLVIESDEYSSRYWCQREILTAKRLNRPIVVMNCLDDYEDRIFPAASNVPRVHVSAGTPLNEKDALRVLSVTIIETIRHCHSMRCLEMYRSEGWIDKDSELIARPPEIRQVLALKRKGKRKICYPEPPIYSDEADWHQQLEVDSFTPLWNVSEQNNLASVRVGISISDGSENGYHINHIHSDYLVSLAQDLSRHLLARSATLLYGGDLRPNGFTEFILNEAAILKERVNRELPFIENHLACPSLYVSDQEIVEWRARYRQIMHTKVYDIPDDIANGTSKYSFLPSDTTQNSYIWSRCLTQMREKSISSSTHRVCVGGKLSGYTGKMPGVLEEIVIAFGTKKPLFLLGAFGGVVSEVCKVILNNKVPESLTEDWQILHNAGYKDLQDLARSYGQDCNYEIIVKNIAQLKVPELSTRAGLEEFEYLRLMSSPFIDECIYLILKGLSKSIT
ncbi:TIR domain-containing protein [Nitrosomonas ureae]|uniref:TIR domain-containing protein n=1 Tax=Nitrosomonas ureae TaxID=44577 RepID=A0A1H2HWF4_9PROT|nr:TIR domain-containing protein [Nitrosomonas ureae]ALQ50477.1 hypothetical protein ATY38_04045 [Nitrosomonas ureae]SDU35858.1 TIR domain-containing protein [Nitrosomonas ureae]